MPELMQTPCHSNAVVADRPLEEMRLRPLLRMKQLASEIQTALRCGDMAIVSQASGLLAPALAQWAEARLPQDDQNAEVVRLTQEVQGALAGCESALAHAMAGVQEKRSLVRRQQQRVKQVRAHKIMPSRTVGNTLNLSR